MESVVIQFPKKNVKAPEYTGEELASKVESDLLSIKLSHIYQTLEIIVPMLFSNIEQSGFDIGSKEDLEKDGTFVVETIKSFLCKYYDLKHPVQAITKELVLSMPDGSYILNKKINADLEEYFSDIFNDDDSYDNIINELKNSFTEEDE